MERLIFLLFNLFVQLEANNEESTFLKVVKDTKLECKDQIHEKGISENFCLAHCHFQEQCHSVNYHIEHKHCIVNLNVPEKGKQSFFVTSAGWQYYEKSSTPKVPSMTAKICGVSLKPVGCFKDVSNGRALPFNLLNHRSKIDWKQYQATLTEVLCDCVNSAKEKNMKFIGLQNYAECFGGLAGVKYNRHGVSTNCVNSKLKQCNDPTIDDICSGKDNANYIYELL